MHSSSNDPGRVVREAPAVSDDEGGLRAPPGLAGWRKAWWWFDFIILVKLARLRFIAVLVAIGVVITKWDTLMAYRDRWTRPAAVAQAGSTDSEYFCPMHPSVVRDDPKEKCPICFMPLSKRKRGSGVAEPLPPGTVNRVQLTPYRLALAGVSTWKVNAESLTKEIKAVGYVEFNERGQRTVSARVKGRLDALVVNETGRMVNEGDVLASLYSPELLVTVQNLLDARRANNAELLASARTRLELLGISGDQIDEIVRTGQANTHLKIRSPISGHVIRKYVKEGEYVDEGSPLYELADLSTVWIQGQIYEDDLAFIPASLIHGQSGAMEDRLPITATTRSFPNHPFQGTLAFVYPHVDQETRTVTVRFEVDNPEHKLRPGTTATVTLNIAPSQIEAIATANSTNAMAHSELAAGRVLAVPESAVIDTGEQKIIYRQASPGVFEGVLVELAPRMVSAEGANFYPVLGGVSNGDLIVSSGSFLVDAETRLNPSAGSIYFGGSGGTQSTTSVQTIRPSTPDDPGAGISTALAKLAPADRELAERQEFCPILENNLLGSMGMPVRIIIEDEPVFLCCAGCRQKALANPEATLTKVRALRDRKQEEAAVENKQEAEIAEALAELSPEDRTLAERQSHCAVIATSRLGSMGPPIKLSIEGQAVFVCCEGCTEQALKDPGATLKQVRALLENPSHTTHSE